MSASYVRDPHLAVRLANFSRLELVLMCSPPAPNRMVARTLYKAVLRAAQRFENASARALAESELAGFRFESMKGRANGLLLSHQVKSAFREHSSKTNPQEIDSLLDKGFLALRKINLLEIEAANPAGSTKRATSSR